MSSTTDRERNSDVCGKGYGTGRGGGIFAIITITHPELNYSFLHSMNNFYVIATHFLSLLSILGSGVPMTSWIFAIWSTSFDPGNKGCKLENTQRM